MNQAAWPPAGHAVQPARQRPGKASDLVAAANAARLKDKGRQGVFRPGTLAGYCPDPASCVRRMVRAALPSSA